MTERYTIIDYRCIHTLLLNKLMYCFEHYLCNLNCLLVYYHNKTSYVFGINIGRLHQLTMNPAVIKQGVVIIKRVCTYIHSLQYINIKSVVHVYIGFDDVGVYYHTP